MCADERVRIRSIHLFDFRNLASVDLTLGEADPFFIGRNGQGKTALLEACGLVTALRSFRTSDLKSVIRHQGSGESGLRFELEHDQRGDTSIELRLGRKHRYLRIDGERISRLRDMVGLFPTVAISSQDIQLLRGGPAERRRFLDLTLAGADADYFESLRDYYQALRDRNALLKRRATEGELKAFEAALCVAAAQVVVRRAEVLKALEGDLQSIYGAFAPAGEVPAMHYRPHVDVFAAEDFQAVLDSSRERDLVLQTTTRGPHRDDLVLSLNEQPAREFGSEGQQRGLVIALKLATVRWVRRQLDIAPVILADDVLNEMDVHRREAFWECMDGDLQVLATGTEKPRGARRGGWSFWSVEGGTIAPCTSLDPEEI